MGRKKARQIQLGQTHDAWLVQRAKELDITVSDLVRRIIDEERERREKLQPMGEADASSDPG